MSPRKSPVYYRVRYSSKPDPVLSHKNAPAIFLRDPYEHIQSPSNRLPFSVSDWCWLRTCHRLAACWFIVYNPVSLPVCPEYVSRLVDPIFSKRYFVVFLCSFRQIEIISQIRSLSPLCFTFRPLHYLHH